MIKCDNCKTIIVLFLILTNNVVSAENSSSARKHQALGKTNQTMKENLQCNLTIESKEISSQIIFTIKLRNNSHLPIQLLSYQTPLEDFLTNVLIIKHKGKALNYHGPMVKRGPPTEADWIVLKPNEQIMIEHDLSNNWEFSNLGKYKVSLLNPIQIKWTYNNTVLHFEKSCLPVYLELSRSMDINR